MNLTNALSGIPLSSRSFAYKGEHYPNWLRDYQKAYTRRFRHPRATSSWLERL